MAVKPIVYFNLSLLWRFKKLNEDFIRRGKKFGKGPKG